ncbi:DMT family transporter [Cohnella suwonensis]|uniref:DMT family transporter n=1 Tax=Cohnella suwonensis TaxID=696072 RepID=A0ABW0M1W8_9BACL
MKGVTNMGWLLLGFAIALELSGTVSMKLSEGFTRLVPSVLMFIFYGASFTLLNYALKYMDVGTVYAVWSGVGIVLITLAGHVLFQERIQASSIIWIAIIAIGVVGLNISSKGH